jgi:hypothetical protein
MPPTLKRCGPWANVHHTLVSLCGETEATSPTDPKVSTTPSSNRFALTLDGIYVLHPIESDLRNRQCTILELPGGGTALGRWNMSVTETKGTALITRA